ncbi:hypothetical protein I5T88_10730 [Stenotrophomonas maltophilia]|nr:hypothetical protein [Stenotrophomonas maltophilia]
MKASCSDPERLTKLAAMLSIQHVSLLLSAWPEADRNPGAYTVASVLVTNPGLGNLVLEWANLHGFESGDNGSSLPTNFGDYEAKLEAAMPKILDPHLEQFKQLVPKAVELQDSVTRKHGHGP